MNRPAKIFGITLLAIIFIALATYILMLDFTLRSILTVGMAGVLIFLPLYKRWKKD